MDQHGALMYDEVEQVYNDEVLNTRRELQESSANLEQLANYCEQSFLTCQDQQAVFDQSKGYVVQSLVNVSHRLTKLSTSLSQLLNAHNGRLEHIGHQLHCIEQDFENIDSYHSKEKVKSLGVTISIQRQHKVVQNKSINKDGKKHIRKPIDLSILDETGHGVVVPDEPRPVPLYQSQNINNIVGRDKGMQRDMSRDNFSNRSHHQQQSQYQKQNGMVPAGLPPAARSDYMGPPHSNNGYAAQQHPPLQPPQTVTSPYHPASAAGTLDSRTLDSRTTDSRTLDRGVTSLERNFDRAMTIDRSIMYDPRNANPLDRHHIIGGPLDKLSDRGSDHQMSPDVTKLHQMSPNVHNQTTFNNWVAPEDPRLRGIERAGYDRNFSHGSGSYERSISSDEYAAQYRRDSPHQFAQQVAGAGYAAQQPIPPYGVPVSLASSRGVMSQGSVTSQSSNHPPAPPQYLGPQFQNAKSYGSRGSLDDSSCTSSSPSLQSYKTTNSRNNPEYDDGSSQRSTNGPFSDSGLGTWAPQADIHQDKIAQPLSDPGTTEGGESVFVPPNFIKKVQAIYRYNKSSDDELSLPVGAIVYVLQEHSDGWSEGYFNGDYGYFPANFTTLADR